MSDLNQRLNDFLCVKAPECLGLLPSIPNAQFGYAGKNLQFIGSFAMEAGQILREKDGLSCLVCFTGEDVEKVEKAYIAALSALGSGQFLYSAVETMKKLPEAMRAIAPYYEQKVSALTAQMEAKEVALENAEKEIRESMLKEDYDSLLDCHYPQLASKLFDNGRTPVPSRTGNVTPMLRRPMAQRLGQELNSAEFSVNRWVSVSEVICRLEWEAVDLYCDIKHASQVPDGITLFTRQLEGVLSGTEYIPEPATPLKKVLELPFSRPSLACRL